MSEAPREEVTCDLRGTSAGCTHVGYVRDTNEDSMICRDDIGLWAVADGMGGHKYGDFASQTVTHHLGNILPCETPKELVTAVMDRLECANREVYTASNDGGQTIGTTIVALLLHSGNGLAIWAGDSRLYRFRSGILEQITRDHTIVQQWIDAGSLTQNEAEDHPHAHILTQALGIASDLTVDVVEVDLQPGDRMVMLSDGVYGALPQKELAVCMTAEGSAGAANALIAAVLAGEAPDNATVVVVDIALANR